MNLHFRGIVLGPSGFAQEGREWLAALEAGFAPSLEGALLGDQDMPLSEAEQTLLQTCAARPQLQPRLCFQHMLIPHFVPDPQASLNVLHTVWEAEGLPAGWADKLNQADLILVMSPWNRDVFAAAGVATEKIRVIPPPFAVERFSPKPRLSQARQPNQPFRWLSVFDWQLRKGHDLLLQAFAQNFQAGEAELYLKLGHGPEHSTASLQEHCNQVVAQHVGSRPAPKVKVLGGLLADEQMRQLYQSVDGFVLASRGEGWGRPVHEAMLMELPVVASHGSALQSLLPNESYGFPVRCQRRAVCAAAALEIPQFQGLHWHEPDLAHLGQQMRQVTEDPSQAQTRAQRGRQHLLQLCDPQRIAQGLAAELQQLVDIASFRNEAAKL